MEEQGVMQSIRIVSLNDRIDTRAKLSNIIILGGQVEQDPIKMQKNLQLVFEAGKNFSFLIRESGSSGMNTHRFYEVTYELHNCIRC